MANQILAGAVFQAGQVIAGVDADTILDTFIAPSSSSSTVANKIFMWSSDAAAYQNGVGRSDVGGLVMTDGDFSNPTTIQLDSPQMVVGGEGKVVTIAQLGEIKVYDESTGQLEQTFNDSYLDSAKANGPSAPWDSANDAVIGAGKIFISAPEYNPQGVGSIIVVDLLDRNVATYLITPTLGNYSRLSATGWGGIRFIDGRIYGHTSQWSSADQGIWHFAPDGSDEQFIPVPGLSNASGFVKWGDNFVVPKDNTIEVIDSSGTTLHSVTKTYASQTYQFGKDIGLTSTGKLVVSNKIHYNPEEYSIFLYDEGLTNEIEFKPADISNGIASKWGYGTTENSGSFEVFGEYILVSAKETDYNGITNCGAVYRYNDSGVLQDIFYGTVADQKIGTNISVGTATTTTALPTFIAPSSVTTSQEVIVRGQSHYNSDMGRVIVYSAVDNSIISTIDGTDAGRKLGTQVLVTDDYILASTTKGVWDDDTTSSIHAYSTSDLTADPIIIGHPLGKGHREFGQAEGQLVVGNGKLFINEGNRLYICDLSNLSAAPVPFEFNSSDGGFDSTGNLNLAQAILVFNPYDNYLYVGQKNAYGGDGAITRLDTNTILTTGGSPETIYSVDAASISSMNFGRNIAIFEDCLYVSAKHAEGSPLQAVYKYNTSSFVSGHTAVPYLAKWSGSTQSLGSNDDFGSYIGSISASSKGTIIGAPNYGASDWNGGYVNTGRVYYMQNYSNGTSSGLTQLNTSSMNLQHNEWAGDEVYTDENYVYAKFTGRSFSGASAVAVWSWDDISAAPTILQTESGSLDIGSLVSREALPTFISPPLPPTPATWVAVGAWADDDNGETSGSTYVYDINNLTAQPTKLTAFDGAGGDYFGWSVSGNNDKIVVGAKYDGDNGLYSGSVYVFDANDLSAQPTKLTAFDGASGDQYSLCTVTTNDKVIVGSAYDDDDGTNSGSVYVYDANDLSAAPTKLKAFDAASGSWFGQAVASNDDKILVGAPSDSNIGAYSENGAVYVYDANDLSAQPTKLTAFDAANVDLFGSSISATADKIVVGAYSDDDMGNTSGSVYVFDANDLSAQPIKLTAFDGESDDYFGWSVCVNSDNIFVGAHGDDDEANAAGAVYVYDLSDLSAQPTKLTAFDGASSDNFGRSLTVSEDNLFVGSYLDDDNGGESGSVYVYDLSDLSAQPTKLTAFDAASGDRFGASVAVG